MAAILFLVNLLRLEVEEAGLEILLLVKPDLAVVQAVAVAMQIRAAARVQQVKVITVVPVH
jgi:hypothetical protein